MMSYRATGRGDRLDLGASCPSVSMVPGAGDHNTGDTLGRDPAWETACTSVAPAPAALLDFPFPLTVEAAMTPRKDHFPHPTPPPPRGAATSAPPRGRGGWPGAPWPRALVPPPIVTPSRCAASAPAQQTWRPWPTGCNAVA